MPLFVSRRFTRNHFAPLVSLGIGLAASTALADGVSADFSIDDGPTLRRGTGFHGGLDANIPAERIDPIKPRMIRRDGGQAWAVAERHAGTIVALLPGYDKCLKAAEWESHVRSEVARIKQRAQENPNASYHYDVWNEPELGEFWCGNREQFFDWWRLTFELLREIDPTAKIAGPSISGYSWDYIKAFLDYAKANDVVPDILGWHDMGGDGRAIETRLAEVKAYLEQQSITISEFELNEIIGPHAALQPGTAVSFAGAIERAGIGWSGRAYWASTERQNLNHLLTNEKQPRSVWWAYERYARLNGRLARVTRGVTADGVAARDDGAKALRVVVGRTTGTTETFDITFSNLDSVPFVNQASRFEITVERIPHSGDAALAEPALVREEEVTLSNGSLVVQVPELGSLDAAYVELRAIGSLPDGGWPDGTGGTSGGTGAGSGGQAGSAGTGGAVSGGGQSNGGQQSGMAGAGGDTPGASGDDGGCACRAASSPAHGASLGLLTVLLVALRRRRASKA